MKNQHLRSLFALGLLCIPPLSHALTLQNYLDEVRVKNGGVRGLEQSAEAKSLRVNEGNLFFKPSFFLNGEYYDDQRPTNAPLFQGTQTLRHTFKTGLSQNFRTGTKASLSYNYYKTQIIGADASLLPNRKFFDIAPQIEITQSLWRNFLGSEFESTANAQMAQVDSTRFMDQYNFKLALIQAENAYWRLYFAQLSLRVQEESLERAKKLRDWNAGRVRSNLVDESDLIQADANLQFREIEFQDTLTEIQTALREFNSLRENQGDVQLEGTTGEDSSYILNATLPQKAPMREDVKAQLANLRLVEANTQIGIQRNRPNLELYGSYSLNGRGRQESDAYDMAFTATRPFSIIGVRFTTPIDVGAMSDYKNAYAKEKVAAEMTYKRKAFEVDREWEILSERFTNFKTRLTLAQKMVKVQERKLTTEKRRYNQGRTTTFQVLEFEQDFANAQLQKLRYERELISVYNQLKLFTGVQQ